MEGRKISLRSVRTDEIEAFDKQPEDVNLMSSKNRQKRQLLVWQDVNINGDPKNSEAYEIEKRQMTISVNNFMTKLYIECQRFKNNDDSMVEVKKYEKIQEDYLMDQVEIAFNLITSLKQLLMMEKTDSVIERSSNRTRFFIKDDDLEAKNEEKKNNRQKALKDKQRKVQIFSEIIDSIIKRYIIIIEMINAPIDYKFLDEFKTSIIPLELKKNITKKKKDTKKEDHCNKVTMLGSPLDILIGRITDPDIKPTYCIIRTDVTSYKTVYYYSCTLYGLNVEGKGSKKEKAKEDAATEMIRLILHKQNDKTLPCQFKPFSEQEINDLQSLIKTKQNYTEF